MEDAVQSEYQNNKDLLIIIVLYNQNLFECETYRSLLAKNSCDVFIYDNSPESQTDLNLMPENWLYEHDPSNSGLGVAYNRGAEYAGKIGKSWIMLADQDTCFPEDFLDKFSLSADHEPEASLFAPVVVSGRKIISPVAYGFFSRQPKQIFSQGYYPLSEFFPINSGSIIRLDAYRLAGGYDEEVFLDYSDYAFFRRMTAICDSFYLIDCVCRQNFSDDVEDRDSKMIRFRLFCESIGNIKYKNNREKVYLRYVVLKRMISLCVKYKSLLPLRTYLSKQS